MLNTELQKEAVFVFARRQNLTRERRRVLAESFGKRMTRRLAWATVKSFALGNLEEVGEDLKRLAHAWLVIGETGFSLTFRIVLVVKDAALKWLEVPEAFNKLLKSLRRIIPISRRKLSRVVSLLRLSLPKPGAEFAFAT